MLENRVTKMISRKYKFHVLKRKICWLILTLRNSFWPDPMLRVTTVFFIWVVMFNLTIFWVREKSVSFSEHRNLVNIRRRIIRWVVYNHLFYWRFLFVRCCPDAFCTTTRVTSVNMPPGHQRDRKMLENSISVCKTFVAFSNINIISLNC